eukprot:10166800-Prorocentrum_lima.AAC.1
MAAAFHTKAPAAGPSPSPAVTTPRSHAALDDDVPRAAPGASAPSSRRSRPISPGSHPSAPPCHSLSA